MADQGLRLTVELGAIPKDMATTPDRLPIAVAYAAIQAGMAYVWRKLAMNTPKGATGKARQSVMTRMARDPVTGDPMGQVYYALPAALYIVFPQEGTAPHWPPIAPLAYWAQRKFSLGAEEAQQVGYMVARSISRHGTKRQDFVGRTVNEERIRTQMMMSQAATRAVARYKAGS